MNATDAIELLSSDDEEVDEGHTFPACTTSQVECLVLSDEDDHASAASEWSVTREARLCKNKKVEANHLSKPPTNESNSQCSLTDLSDSDDDLINGPAIFTNSCSQSSMRSNASQSQKSLVSNGSRYRATFIPKESIDTSLSNNRKLSREEKAAEKRRIREEEKRQKQRKKDEAKGNKKRILELEKIQKETEKVALKASKGGYAKEEVCCLIETGLASDKIGTELRSVLSSEDYTVVAEDHSIKNSIRFTRRDKKHGSAAASGKFVKHFDIIFIFFPKPKEFLEMLMYDPDEDRVSYDEYPRLTKWLMDLKSKLSEERRNLTLAETEAKDGDCRIVLVLHGVERELRRLWNRQSSERRRSGPSILATEEELKDAITYLIVEHRVEIELCTESEEYTDYMSKQQMTRFLSQKCYHEDFTELDCVKRHKVYHDANVDSNPLQKAQQVWRNELCMIPNMSMVKANEMIKYFPTRRSLHEAYKNPDLTDAQKRVLLTYCLGKSAQVTLSDMVYRYMTTLDPDELI